MSRFQKGDVSAFEVLLHKFEGPVHSLVRRYLGSKSPGVDDVAQEVFIRVFRSKHTYEPKAKVSTWIYRITVNTCLNEIRRLGAEKNRRVAGFSAVFGDDDGGDASQGALADPAAGSAPERMESSELERRVKAAVDALPEQQRLAVVLSRYHGLPYEEVAASMDSSVPAIKSLLTRARENLRKALSAYVTGSDYEAASAGAPTVPDLSDEMGSDDDEPN
jgi:RNA polymerase sigma-70 factor (ECF subfamily)